MSTKTKITDINPNSIVRVRDTRGAIDDMQGAVLELLPHWGAAGNPGISVLPDGDSSKDPVIYPDDGRWEITVLLDSSELAPPVAPANAYRVQRKPVLYTAVRFMGSVEEARDIIRWTASRAPLFYEQDTNGVGRISSKRVGDKLELYAGDWLLVGEHDVLKLSNEQYTAEWEATL